jgi:hypothetical protein
MKSRARQRFQRDNYQNEPAFVVYHGADDQRRDTGDPQPRRLEVQEGKPLQGRARDRPGEHQLVYGFVGMDTA